MVIETFPVGPLGCNCSILIDPASKSAIVIDPGGDFDVIRRKLEAAEAKVTAIVHTHTHIDHVGATAEVQRWSGAPARIHEDDRFLYEMLPVQAALLGIPLPADLRSRRRPRRRRRDDRGRDRSRRPPHARATRRAASASW